MKSNPRWVQSLIRCIPGRPSQDSGWTKKKQQQHMIRWLPLRWSEKNIGYGIAVSERGRRKKKSFNIVYRNFKELIKSLQVSIICLIFFKGYCWVWVLSFLPKWRSMCWSVWSTEIEEGIGIPGEGPKMVCKQCNRPILCILWNSISNQVDLNQIHACRIQHMGNWKKKCGCTS